MAKDNFIKLRCTDEFKAQIEALASKENRTVSNYIENLLSNEINKNKKENAKMMDYEEMVSYVDEVCNIEGYEDSPAYDLIYSECCNGRNGEDAKEMILDMLRKYNE